MISLKMRLSRIQIIEGIIFPLFLLYACNEPQKPASYVARVNGSYLTEEDVSQLIDSQFVSEKSRTSLIKNWVRQEVLYQEAVKEGITKTKSFQKSIESAKRELAAAILLEKFSSSSKPVYTNENLENYYNENHDNYNNSNSSRKGYDRGCVLVIERQWPSFRKENWPLSNQK